MVGRLGVSVITDAVACKAIMGAQIMSKGELFASYNGRVPDDNLSALKIVQGAPSEFKCLVLSKLDTIPFFSKYFGNLLKIRLNQEGYLSSSFIGVVFDNPNLVEERLRNITKSGVVGLEFIKKEYRHVSKSPSKGDETDKVVRDLLAEILVLDFLVQLGFIDIERPFSQSQPHIDVLAKRDGQIYAIETTRKQEINDWKTLKFGNLEDCDHKDNLEKIQLVLWRTLWKKNDQFSRAVASETVSARATKVVAIKTSDYGFAECAEQAEEILKRLLANTDKLKYVDCVWLLPNIEPDQSKWLCR